MAISKSGRASCIARALRGLFICLGLLWTPLHAQEIVFPPGTRPLRPRELPKHLPLGYAVAGFQVDWTHPLLKTTPLADGAMLRPAAEDQSEQDALTWQQAARKYPSALLIQLIEPRQPETTYPLQVSLAGTNPLSSHPPGSPQEPTLLLGGLVPWLPPTPDITVKVSAAAQPRAHFGLRWCGRLADLPLAGEIEFRDRLLLSLTSPDLAVTQFLLIYREDGRLGQWSDLRAWVTAAGTPAAWLAVHAGGPQTIIGQGELRLGPPADPRRAERVGAMLALQALQPGDPVDWARLRGAVWQASSFERDFPPALLGIGIHPGDLLNPRLWISRPQTLSPATQPPWVQLTFNRPRTIHQISIVWANTLGWDAGFKPGEANLRVRTFQGDEVTLKIDLLPSGDPVSVLKLTTPRQVESIRLELPEPESAANPQPRARVVALQAWGPWDGATERGADPLPSN